MNYAEALNLTEAALEADPLVPSVADLELVFRFNLGSDRVELAEFYDSVYVGEGFRLIVAADGSGYLVRGDRVYFIPSEADDDEPLAEALV